MTAANPVRGWCPMGCGETLMLEPTGRVRCEMTTCPEPYTVTNILVDPETEHVVRIGDGSFALQHPLRERMEGALFDCPVHRRLGDLGTSPVAPGTYRVRTHPSGGLSWEALD